MEKGDKVGFSKYDGGKMVAADGLFDEATQEFVVVRYIDDGSEKTCKFKRAAGPKAGWGIGVSRLWRLDEPERMKYCHAPKRR